MTTEHLPTEEITQDWKQPKKTSTNSSIARKVFDEQHHKQLKILLFINCYNHHMNSINITNQLQVTATVYFSQNKKEFFSEMF